MSFLDLYQWSGGKRRRMKKQIFENNNGVDSRQKATKFQKV